MPFVVLGNLPGIPNFSLYLNHGNRLFTSCHRAWKSIEYDKRYLKKAGEYNSGHFMSYGAIGDLLYYLVSFRRLRFVSCWLL